MGIELFFCINSRPGCVFIVCCVIFLYYRSLVIHISRGKAPYDQDGDVFIERQEAGRNNIFKINIDDYSDYNDYDYNDQWPQDRYKLHTLIERVMVCVLNSMLRSVYM